MGRALRRRARGARHLRPLRCACAARAPRGRLRPLRRARLRTHLALAYARRSAAAPAPAPPAGVTAPRPPLTARAWVAPRAGPWLWCWAAPASFLCASRMSIVCGPAGRASCVARRPAAGGCCIAVARASRFAPHPPALSSLCAPPCPRGPAGSASGAGCLGGSAPGCLSAGPRFLGLACGQPEWGGTAATRPWACGTPQAGACSTLRGGAA